jgi:hypothetical protein
MCGLILDFTQGTQSIWPGMAWTTLAEWLELAAQTILTAACLECAYDRLHSGRSIAFVVTQRR